MTSGEQKRQGPQIVWIPRFHSPQTPGQAPHLGGHWSSEEGRLSVIKLNKSHIPATIPNSVAGQGGQVRAVEAEGTVKTDLKLSYLDLYLRCPATWNFPGGSLLPMSTFGQLPWQL